MTPHLTPARRIGQQMQYTDQQIAAPRCATVPVGKTDPTGAREMCSMKAPAGEKYKVCFKELETANAIVPRLCDTVNHNSWEWMWADVVQVRLSEPWLTETLRT